MKVRLYQIDPQEDRKNVKFQSFKVMRERSGTPNNDVDASIYKKVFDGDVFCERLEDIHRVFMSSNLARLKGFTGHSLAVSDVLEVEDKFDRSLRHYYVDDMGMKLVGFLPLYVFTVSSGRFKPCGDQVTNAIMFALDGMRVTENSLKFALWRLRDFFGQGIPEHKQTKWGADYDAWVKQSPRVQIGEYSYPYQLPNIALGYTSCETLVERLQKKGEIIIPLDSVFDPRQSIRANFKGCTLSVKRCV